MTLPPLGTRPCFRDNEFFHYNCVPQILERGFRPRRDAQARRGCCATIRCLTQIHSLYKHVPLAGFCFVFVNHVLVTRQHESGDVFTLYAGSDPFSLYYIGHRGPPATHHPSEEFGLRMIMQY